MRIELNPENIAGLDSALFIQLTESLTEEMRRISGEIADGTEKVSKIHNVLEVIRGIQTGWQQADPGKYFPACWFLGEDGRRAVVLDLLPEGTVMYSEGDRERWRQYARPRFVSGKYDAVGPDYVVLSFEETKKTPCPKCRKPQPVIEFRSQTFDSPLFDKWTGILIVLCCDGIQEISKDVSSVR